MEPARERRKPLDDCCLDLGDAIAESITRTPTEHLVRKGISKLRIINETKLLRLVGELVEDAIHTRLSRARQGSPPTPQDAFPSATVFDDPPRAEPPDIYILDDGLEWTTKDGFEWSTTPERANVGDDTPTLASRPRAIEFPQPQTTQKHHRETLARIESCFSCLEEGVERIERFLGCRTHPERSENTTKNAMEER